MTVKEFKIKFPQYSHLEGDDLWNKMEEVLLDDNNVLYADPNQEKVYLAPIETPYGKVTIEDSSTTRWLDKKGNLVRVGEFDYPQVEKPTESYRLDIIDFSK